MAAVNSVARAYVETCKMSLSMMLEQCSKLQEFQIKLHSQRTCYMC